MNVRCPQCNGTGVGFYEHDENGELLYSYPCEQCNGCGYMEVEDGDD